MTSCLVLLKPGDTFSDPMKMPSKRSLVSETYRVLYEAIQSGRWKTTLPGERSLCELFQISRPTLRQALQQLQNEKIIANHHGQKRHIIKRSYKKRFRHANRLIGYLCPRPAHQMQDHTNRKIAAIQHIIQQRNINFIHLVRPGCFTHSPGRALQALIRQIEADCWIIQQSNKEMQTWFEDKNIPVVISGTRHGGINLPYIDLDNKAICRHAVSLLITKNRKNICYLTTKDRMAGDLLSETGFLEGIKTKNKVNGFVTRHSGTRKSIRHKLDLLLNSQNRPDAIVIDKANHAFSVASYLLIRGFSLPQDISLICRTESQNLSDMCPAITHYSRNIKLLAKKTAEMAIKITEENPSTSRETLLFPKLIPGESI